MTLIPLISAMMTAPVTGAPAGRSATPARTVYGSDHRRHPVAAFLAVALPAALVVAVALSPMIVVTPPKSLPMTGTLIELPKPPPPPESVEDAKPTPKTASATETVAPRVETEPLGTARVDVGPVYDTRPIDPGPPARPADPPAPPKLVLAELDARYAGAFQPDYPAREQRRGIEGSAKVRVLIGTDGRVKAVELVSTDSPGFFEETRRRALAKWRFKPATRGGVAEESWQVMTVRFQIRSA